VCLRYIYISKNKYTCVYLSIHISYNQMLYLSVVSFSVLRKSLTLAKIYVFVFFRDKLSILYFETAFSAKSTFSQILSLLTSFQGFNFLKNFYFLVTKFYYQILGGGFPKRAYLNKYMGTNMGHIYPFRRCDES
jgi:hypothetical protein